MKTEENKKFEIMKKMANEGSVTDQYNLGVYYGKKKDAEKSIYWYQLAAAKRT